MKLKTVPRGKWLKQAERRGINMLRCVRWIHKDSAWNDFRHMENHLLIFVEQGSLEVELDGSEIKLDSGDAVWISPGVLRRTKPLLKKAHEKDFRLHFSLGTPNSQFRFLDASLALCGVWELLPLFQILARAHLYPGRYVELCTRGTCLALAADFLSLMERKKASDFSHDRFKKICAYVAENLSGKITSEELARVAGFSPDYFSRKFKKNYGVSPSFFIKREKMCAAANFLLDSNIPVKELAFRFGYEDLSFFYRQFREVMDCSPANYRKRNA